ncbi:hypothetical protein [Pseudomonas sp. Pseusp97]|uniref:hypothetical protein n=1 Tax=Pseudomonas sp. Pseusp97 TaxID=3243065 RepID=UPI0039A620B3
MQKKPYPSSVLHLAADNERFTNARKPSRYIDQLIDGVATTLFVIRAARQPPTVEDLQHAKDLIGKVDILVELAKLETGVTQLDIRAGIGGPGGTKAAEWTLAHLLRMHVHGAWGDLSAGEVHASAT